MKRQRSYGDDLDDAFASGERSGGGSWQRRDLQDADRSTVGPPSSHHRRPSSLYSKEISSRKGPSAASSSYDDDREAMRRKRFDHDADAGGFDRRKGGFDHYRDVSGQRLSSSPRDSSYGGGGGRGTGERMMYRSESFSVLRREFPKGFRSERDRSRREGSGGSSGSSWSRRSNIWKEGSSASVAAAADESKKSPSVDSDAAGRRSRPVTPTEDRRGKEKYRDTSSGEQRSLRKMEMVKVEGRSAVSSRTRANDSSSEMEEGELEPDPGPEPVTEASNDGKTSTLQLEPGDKVIILQYDNTLETKKLEMIEELSTDKKPEVHVEGKINVMAETKSIDVAMGEVRPVVAMNEARPVAAVPDHEKIGIMELMHKRKEGTFGDTDERDILEGKTCLDEQEVAVKVDDNLSMKLKNEESRKKADDELEPMVSVCGPLLEEKLQVHEGGDVSTEAKTQGKKKEEADKQIEFGKKEHRGIDLEAEPDGALCAAVLFDSSKKVDDENRCDRETSLFDSTNKVICETSCEGVTLTLMPDKPKENCKDKGKNLEISISCLGDSVQEVDATACPSGRGFEWVLNSDIRHQENSQSVGACMGKQSDEKIKVETLDLSLSLPGGSSEHPITHLKAKPDASSLARSIQSMPSSFRTGSDGLTTSISFTNSQTFLHNPSCSLQNSIDNYENSVGSRPLLQGMDQVSNGPIWHAQSSNDAKQNGAVPLFQRVLLNGNSSNNAFHNVNGEHQSKPNGLLRQTSLSRPSSPQYSHGSRDTRSEYSKDKRVLTRERSGNGLFRNEQHEGEQLVLNGAGVTEKILSKIVSEPLHLNSRMLQDMTEQSVAYLKETICEILMDLDKSRQIHLLQQALQRRSDICIDTLTKCSRVLLEILVSIKTGLPDFIQRSKGISSSDLADIFLNLKCRNLACQSVLPVEDCDCKVCTQRTGFCSACMCLVCSKFDNASNTCSWVGCDVCLHWCHTDCALRESHIRNAQSPSNLGMTEMQFHCIACDHPSELFGFVKEVFKSCAKEWKAETLVKELQYVRRIFSASTDVRGKTLCNVAEKMLMKFENKANHSEVVAYIMTFLSGSDSESNVGNPLPFPSKEPTRVDDEGIKVACSTKDVRWLQPVPQERAHLLENTGVSMVCKKVRTSRENETQTNIEKKPIIDELESVVKFKQAEAKMYQERADAARREAEGLKCIAKAKILQDDEDFGNRIGKLQLDEVKERRKQKFEELQAIERSNHEYFNMKNRMEADIKDLLLKMEATRCNLNT